MTHRLTALRPLFGLALLCLAASPQAQTGAERDAEAGPYTATFRDAPLDRALAELVDLTGIELAYSAGLVEGARAVCSRRGASAEALLRCVLAGTGLDFVRSSSGAYVLIRAVREEPARVRLAGRVVDAATGEPLPDAHVLLADGSAGTAAGAGGLFAFASLLPGDHQLVATHVGYAPALVTVADVAPGAGRVVELRLVTETIAPRTVVVDGLTQRLPSEGLGIGVREALDPADRSEREGGLLAAPGLGGTADVARGAAGVLGVSAALPLADLHVQGGATAEHVTRLDGAPVRDPVALGRHLGAFSPLALGRTTVRKAGFEAQHGSALAGVVDLAHDLGDRQFGAVLQTDPVSLNGRVGGPVQIGRAEGSAFVAARASAWDAYRDPGLSELLDDWSRFDPAFTGTWLGEPVTVEALQPAAYAPDVAFSDLHAAVRVQPNAYGTASAAVYRARNHVAARRAVVLADDAGDRLLGVRDVYDWTNWAGSARYAWLVGARGLVGVRATLADHRSAYGYRFGWRPGGTAPDAAFFDGLDDGRGDDAEHALVERTVEAEGTLSLGPGREISAALGAEWVTARFGGDNAFIAPIDIEADAAFVTGRAGARTMLGRRATLDIGVRLTAVPSRQTVYAEPRLSARYDSDWPGVGAVAVRGAAGLYRQFVNGLAFRSASPAAVVPELFFWLPVTADVAPPHAVHLAADALVLPGERWTVRAEAFARFEGRTLALDVPLLQTATEAATHPSEVVTSASGRVVGGGLRAQYAGPRLSLAAAYSAERARRTVPGRFDGRAVPTPWEAPHRLSADVRLGLGAGLSVEGAGRAVWGRSWAYRAAYYDYLLSSGAPPLARPLAARLADPGEPGLPALYTLDLSAGYTRLFGVGRADLRVGMANVLDRDNTYDLAPRALNAPDEAVARTLPGRRWTASLRVSF